MVFQKRLLRGVVREALQTNARKREHLELQLLAAANTDMDGVAPDDKAGAKALRRAQAVPQHLAEVDTMSARLVELRDNLASTARSSENALAEVRGELVRLGLERRLFALG